MNPTSNATMNWPSWYSFILKCIRPKEVTWQDTRLKNTRTLKPLKKKYIKLSFVKRLEITDYGPIKAQKYIGKVSGVM